MKKRKYSRIIIMVLCALLVLLAPPITASADMGPKPSVWIRFENMGDELCYGTLLSYVKSTGPARVWDGTNDGYHDSDADVWRKFVDYEDPDGYYYLQRDWKVSETKEIAWTYYPPSEFKILLYYPETNTFVSSGIYKKYAFDSYYTVDMDGVNSGSTGVLIKAKQSYKYEQEILSLVVRIILTIAVELIIALLFGFRKKNQLLILTVVNIVTQVILNVLLNFVNYKSGGLAFLALYLLLEIFVVAIEAALYCTILKKVSEKKKNWYYVLYALVANAVSYGVGLYLAIAIPGMF